MVSITCATETAAAGRPATLLPTLLTCATETVAAGKRTILTIWREGIDQIETQCPSPAEITVAPSLLAATVRSRTLEEE